jgi:hypothetical protein
VLPDHLEVEVFGVPYLEHFFAELGTKANWCRSFNVNPLTGTTYSILKLIRHKVNPKRRIGLSAGFIFVRRYETRPTGNNTFS